MGRSGEAPIYSKIASEPDDEDALPNLRNAEIGGVEEAGDDLIANSICGAVGVNVLKPLQVRLPV